MRQEYLSLLQYTEITAIKEWFYSNEVVSEYANSI